MDRGTWQARSMGPQVSDTTERKHQYLCLRCLFEGMVVSLMSPSPHTFSKPHFLVAPEMLLKTF